MAELNRDIGATFVFATHDARVMDRSRRLVRMVDGGTSTPTRPARNQPDQPAGLRQK